MKKFLLLLLLVPGLASAQGFSLQGTANSVRSYSVDGVTMPAFSVSAGYQPGRHWYFGLRAGDGYDEAESGLERKFGLMAETRFYLLKSLYAGGSLGFLHKPDAGTDGVAWSLTLLGSRQAIGHGLYVGTELSVGNLAPGMSFSLGYCPRFVKKSDETPLESRWELEAGFPFFVYGGYRLSRNVGLGVSAESFRKQVKVQRERVPSAYSCAALEVRFYFLNLGGFELYSATGGGLARLVPDGHDTLQTWYWDNTWLGFHQRIRGGRVYVLGALRSGTLGFNGHVGVGIRI